MSPSASRGIRPGTLGAESRGGDLSLRDKKMRNAKRAALCCALLLLSVLMAGCGGRARAMGWSAPVVDNGTLYFGSKMGKLYALDIETRETVWSFPAEGALAGIYSTPVIRDGSLFFGSYEIATTSFLIFQNQDIQGRGYALEVTKGEEDWHFPKDSSQDPEPFIGSPALGGGLVYFTSSDGDVYALEMETGALKWSFEGGKEIWAGPAWADGTLYVGSADKNLYAFDAATGDQRWHFTAGGAIYTTPYINGDLVYFGALDNKVYAVDTESGAEVWTYQTGNWVWAGPVENGGLLYAASLDHSLYALDAASGALRWAFEAGDMIPASPVIADGVVFLAAREAGVYALEAETGGQLWHYPEEGVLTVLASPAVADGLVYVNADDGKLYALDSATGKLQWEVAPGAEE